jgi:hypothetical protein
MATKKVAQKRKAQRATRRVREAKSPYLKQQRAARKARKIAKPIGRPEIVYVVCSKDPTHTDKKSHVLAPFKGTEVCGCGAPLKERT